MRHPERYITTEQHLLLWQSLLKWTAGGGANTTFFFKLISFINLRYLNGGNFNHSRTSPRYK